MASRGSTPTRLALQTGWLDDHRRHLEPDDDLWSDAYQCFLAREEIDSAPSADTLPALCEHWSPSAGPAGHAEALAVTVALASPFAGRDRILKALSAYSVGPDPVGGERSAPALRISPWSMPRPPFPYIYDPDAEERAPIIAVVDGPRSPKVAELLDAIKQRDKRLADAIVLGADVDTLESLDRLSLDASDAPGWENLAAQIDHDRARWQREADQARLRQRLEGIHYGWRSDNFPPGCLEAARAEPRHDVDVLLEHPPTSPPR